MACPASLGPRPLGCDSAAARGRRAVALASRELDRPRCPRSAARSPARDAGVKVRAEPWPREPQAHGPAPALAWLWPARAPGRGGPGPRAGARGQKARRGGVPGHAAGAGAVHLPGGEQVHGHRGVERSGRAGQAEAAPLGHGAGPAVPRRPGAAPGRGSAAGGRAGRAEGGGAVTWRRRPGGSRAGPRAVSRLCPRPAPCRSALPIGRQGRARASHPIAAHRK